MLEFEEKYLIQGYKLIAGMDEVGRGPLAGPVCCACVIMPLNNLIKGVKDSKKLLENKRNELAVKISEQAICFAIEYVDNNIIDEINILNATKLAMNKCVQKMVIQPDMVLIDYVAKPNFQFNYETIVKGDNLSYNIACASIIAKVARDKLMKDYSLIYPQFGFEKHKGYGTQAHYSALSSYGPCELHRKTFIK